MQAGIIVVGKGWGERYRVEAVLRHGVINPEGERWSEGEMKHLGGLGVVRYWNLRRE